MAVGEPLNDLYHCLRKVERDHPGTSFRVRIDLDGGVRVCVCQGDRVVSEERFTSAAWAARWARCLWGD